MHLLPRVPNNMLGITSSSQIQVLSDFLAMVSIELRNRIKVKIQILALVHQITEIFQKF
jgi:hypothetical protein